MSKSTTLLLILKRKKITCTTDPQKSLQNSSKSSKNSQKFPRRQQTPTRLSVVPSDLPMQLALAVNASLMQLMKRAVFCTEPFRVPMAGKVCFCFLFSMFCFFLFHSLHLLAYFWSFSRHVSITLLSHPVTLLSPPTLSRNDESWFSDSL
jgi:hypothetical protein